MASYKKKLIAEPEHEARYLRVWFFISLLVFWPLAIHFYVRRALILGEIQELVETKAKKSKSSKTK